MAKQVFEHGLFGCFNNCSLCIISFLLPCYTVGKTAGSLGDSCLCKCLLMAVPILNIIIICQQRGDIREKQDIRGGKLRDAVYSIFCPFCVIVQNAQEVRTMDGEMAIDRS